MRNTEKTMSPEAVSVLAKAFLDPGAHRAALPLLAELMRDGGRSHEALMLIDRYHRTGPDTGASRLTEAMARARLAGPEHALPALRRAVLLDPTDAGAARVLLRALVRRNRSHEAAQTLEAALQWAADPRDAVELLALGRPTWQAWGACERQAGAIAGWIAWTGAGARRELVLDVAGREWRVGAVASDKVGPARIARFAAPFPSTAGPVHVRDCQTGEVLAGSPLIDDTALDAGEPPFPDDGAVAVVIPVYGDVSATARCLDSVLEAGCTTPHRLVVVDDASQAPAIRRLLERLAGEGRITVLRNPVNTGFVRAVNRALRRLPAGDVVLLNADTVVPPGWLDRLAAVAAIPGTGTVTPLSNNGELVSLPRPFRPNPLPSREGVAALDRRLAEAARECGLPPALEMPNGIGFCLYLTAAARAAAGLLDAVHYRRGYLEEVDYSLRVREAGLRNMCATGVYVGHEGTVSFGLEKRALVRLNARTLSNRWPEIHRDTDAFVAADPLRPLRLRHEWLAPADGAPRTALVVARRGHADRIREMAVPGAPALVLSLGEDGRLEAQGAPGMPWVPLDDDGHTPLAQRLAEAGVARLLFADWLDLSAATLEGLARCGLPHDLFVFDFAPLAAPRRAGTAGTAAALVVSNAGTIVCPSHAALKAMVTAWPAHQPRIVLAEIPPASPFPRSVPVNPAHVGVLVPDDSPSTHALVASLSATLAARCSPVRLIVIGATADDTALLRRPGVFVAGPAPDAASVLEALDTHACASLFLAFREPLFAHPALEAARVAGLSCTGWPAGEAGAVLAALPQARVLRNRATMAELAFALEAQLSSRMPDARVA